jgi:hypothetical protein
MADELAERFKRAIPANILGQGPPPELQQDAAAEPSLLQQIVARSFRRSSAEAHSKVKKGVDDSRSRSMTLRRGALGHEPDRPGSPKAYRSRAGISGAWNAYSADNGCSRGGRSGEDAATEQPETVQ